MLRAFDLFCGTGGMGKGLLDAGFIVDGIDIEDHPEYPGTFIRGDVMTVKPSTFVWGPWDFYHASTPCQHHCTLTAGTNQGRLYPDYTLRVRDVLKASGKPFVMENPLGRTPLKRDMILCGEMFELSVIRHRIFEFGNMPAIPAPKHLRHRGRVAGMRHGEWYDGPYFAVYGDGGGKGSIKEWQDAMEIHWTDKRKNIAEAIPPVYGEYVGIAVRLVLMEGYGVDRAAKQAYESIMDRRQSSQTRH